ncbi:Vacuolar iron transporter like 4 [Apostasia shenzhenica]|uniref:Vacuolar iron transporter n=1 Tax=Apostasia shenzhenica TaxID=1088818 RepID=A0A2I0AD62_9ASPA|nr:Vacuolar iron transporter like 4 [Apostasia shenzhenica]
MASCNDTHAITIHSVLPPPSTVLPEIPLPASNTDYAGRAQWLRAAVLGANDGLVSVASLMIGVGAVNQTAHAMLISGAAGLVAGAASMAVGEFVSVYTQYDSEVAQMRRENIATEKPNLPSPAKAAAASAAAFAVGAALPLFAGGFIRPLAGRVAAVSAASTVGLVGFGAAGAVLGGASGVVKSAARVLAGGWIAMLATYGVLRVFGIAFHININSSSA